MAVSVSVRLAEHVDSKWAAMLSDSGWHLADRLRDRMSILVNDDASLAYVFAESLLGTAVQPYEVQ